MELHSTAAHFAPILFLLIAIVASRTTVPLNKSGKKSVIISNHALRSHSLALCPDPLRSSTASAQRRGWVSGF